MRWIVSAIITLLLCLGSSGLFAQGISVVGLSGVEKANAVLKDVDGGYIICGEYAPYSGASQSVYVVKLDSFGKVEWARLITLTGNSFVTDVVKGLDGYLYVTGWYVYSFTPYGFVIKMDVSGNIVWIKRYVSAEIRDILAVSDGSFLLTGSIITSSTDDIFIARIDSSGSIQWANVYLENPYSSLQNEIGTRAIETPEGNFLITGYFTDPNDGKQKALLMEIDGGGAIQWASLYHRSVPIVILNEVSHGTDITISPNGDIFLGGYTNAVPDGTTSFFLVKADRTGAGIWEVAIGGDGTDASYGLVNTADGNIVLSGYTNSFGNNLGTDMVYLVKVSQSGNFLWSRVIDAGVSLSNLLEEPDSSLVVVGSTTLSSIANDNMLLLKVNSNGLINSSDCNITVFIDSGSVWTGALTQIDITGAIGIDPYIALPQSDTTVSVDTIFEWWGCGDFSPCVDFRYTLDSIDTVSCFGYSDGAIYISVSGGKGPYQHKWSDGTTTEDLIGVPAGTYIDTITDAQGCLLITDPIVVPEPTPLTVTLDSIKDSIECYGDSTGFIYITVFGGTMPYYHNWTNGSTSEDLINIPAGIYVDTITDSKGCTVIAGPYEIKQPTPTIITANITNASCNGNADGAIDITVSGGKPPYSYDWSHLPGTNDPEDITGIPAGTYVVTVTDSFGCSLSESFTVTEPDSLHITAQIAHVSCAGGSDGSIDITITGGTMPYSYDWSHLPGTNDPEDLTGIVSGWYVVSITDANSCSVVDSFFVDEPDSLRIDAIIKNATCDNSSDGFVYITVTGGTIPYTYDWNHLPGTNNPKDALSLPPGQYTITITDANGCSLSETYSIGFDGFSPEIISSNVIDAGCYGDKTGEIYISVAQGTPPYNFLWIPTGRTSQNLIGVYAGTYRVIVTDSLGCQTTDSFVVSEPDPLTVHITVKPQNILEPTISGGTPPYECMWTTGDTTCQIQATTQGLYAVTVTDANGCSASDVIGVITEVSDVTKTQSTDQCSVYTASYNALHVKCYSTVERIRLISIDGKVIYESSVKEVVHSLPIRNLSHGIFLVEIQLQSGEIERKIIRR